MWKEPPHLPSGLMPKLRMSPAARQTFCNATSKSVHTLAWFVLICNLLSSAETLPLCDPPSPNAHWKKKPSLWINQSPHFHCFEGIGNEITVYCTIPNWELLSSFFFFLPPSFPRNSPDCSGVLSIHRIGKFIHNFMNNSCVCCCFFLLFFFFLQQ